jgi:hypothetical protein
MTKVVRALTVLAKIRDLLEKEQYGTDMPEAKQRFAGLIRILKMHTSGIFPNDTRQIHLGEQVGKLDQCKDDLYSGRQPRCWQTHEECKGDMLTRCDIAQSLIELYGKESEDVLQPGPSNADRNRRG